MLITATNMLSLAKIGLAIVIILAVARILITPDPTDDVNGVLQQRHLVKATVVLLFAVQSQPTPPSTVGLPRLRFQPPIQNNRLDLTCVLLC